MTETLERGRSFYARRAWREAFEALREAEKDGRLPREDLELLAWSAALIGRDDQFLAALERLHRACLEAAEPARAARAAFWIGFHLSSLGSPGRATGWLTRAERLVAAERECAEHGYLLLPLVFRHFAVGEDTAAYAAASEAAAIGERCTDADLVALARNLEGRALLRLGRARQGLALLDEVMVAATADELSPLVTGIVYCNVITTCQQMHALDRAREWTAALARWCDEQPELVTFTGHCLVHRCEIMQLCGDWSKANEELEEVCERPSLRGDPEVFGDACYHRAELLRLRGDLRAAEAAYRLANDSGREPQPGLALLRLAQGHTDVAVGAMRRVVAATRTPWQRGRHLPAFVEILLAAGELEEAGAACAELEDLAQRFDSEVVAGMGAHARGALQLAEDDPQNAATSLRRAFDVWHRVGAPYLAAKARALLGRAYRALGDEDGARLEWDAAREVFARLEAQPDLDALDELDRRSSRGACGLSKRELEVLNLLAQGMTNKSIGRRLGLSERTIDRHVSNILAKLDVTSRTAAAAYAYEHGLI